MLGAMVLLAVATAIPDASSRVQLDAGGAFGYTAFAPPQKGQPFDEHSLSGSGGAGVTLYPRPLVDDDAPLSLQPFLQRLTTLRLSVGAGGFDTTQSQPYVGERIGTNASAQANADVYVTRHFIAGLSAGLGWSRTRDQYPASPTVIHDYYSIPLALWAGARFRDTRIDLTWSVSPLSSDGAWQVPYWYGVSLSVRSVIQRYVDLYLNVHAIELGAAGTIQLGVYPSRRFGVFAAFSASGGKIYFNEAGTFDRFGGSLGFSLWSSRHFGASFSYQPTWTSGPTESTAHVFSLEFLSRVK